MSDFKWDLFGGLGSFKDIQRSVKIAKAGFAAKRFVQSKSARREVEELYGPEVADAVEAAIRDGRNPAGIVERAKRDLESRLDRERQLASPPPLYGSARWPAAADLTRFLGTREDFDNPSSILLGTFTEEGQAKPAGFVHWDDEGHLLTIAPSRSGKSVTTIVPNLLRYQGSCVVLDPKGELYEMTSKQRRTYGKVYRIAPFDDGRKDYPVDRFNPLAQVRRQSDARALAEQLFPRDPKSSEFFMDDVVSFITALIMYIKHHAPPERRSLATVYKAASLKGGKLLDLARKFEAWPPAAEIAENLLGKNKERGLPTFQDSVNSKLALWSDPDILRSVSGGNLDFASLKDETATVYIDIPFHLMGYYAPWLRVVLKSTLDAMIRNPNKPDIPVLFLLDEFLSLGPFNEFRDAIRTHAGSGVRLWFFLQDLPSLQEYYLGTAWQPFLNCAVKQFFGIDDPFTGELIGKYLGHETVAYLRTSASANTSSRLGRWPSDASTNTGFSSDESIQFLGRPLLTPDEVMALLSDWVEKRSWRWGITQLRGPRAFKTQLGAYSKSETCNERIGALTRGNEAETYIKMLPHRAPSQPVPAVAQALLSIEDISYAKRDKDDSETRVSRII